MLRTSLTGGGDEVPLAVLVEKRNEGAAIYKKDADANPQLSIVGQAVIQNLIHTLVQEIQFVKRQDPNMSVIDYLSNQHRFNVYVSTA
jgi:hypothetical protein